MRALDYLETRADVDPERMGVTGLSGGGVISWCLGAADERVKVVVPVCQSGSVGGRRPRWPTATARSGSTVPRCRPDLGMIAPAFLIASGTERALAALWISRRGPPHPRSMRRARPERSTGQGPHPAAAKLRQRLHLVQHALEGRPRVTDDVTDFVGGEPARLRQAAGNDQMRRLTPCW